MTELSILQRDNAVISFRQAGEAGPPLVFIHGWADSSIVWARALEEWAPRFRVVALDQPGHGGSAPVAPEAGVAGIAACLADALEALSLSDIRLVGHSLGGLVALRLTLDFPHLVERLVLVNPAWSGRLPPPLPALLREPLVIGAMKLNRPWRSALGWLPERLRGQMSERQRAQLRRWQEFNHVAPEWLYHTVTLITSSDLRAELAGVTQPALVLAGTRDPLILPEWSRELAQLLPNAQYSEIEAGHQAAEDNFPAFRTALKAFLGDP